MKRTLVAVVLAIVFVLALAMPAFAQVLFVPFASMNHNAAYEWDGNAREFDRWAYTEAGAYSHQISGEGKMTKNTMIAMVPFKMTVEDNNQFVTSPTAVVNMRVSSKVDLTTPGLWVYEGAFVLPTAMYGNFGMPRQYVGGGVFAGGTIAQNDPTSIAWVQFGQGQAAHAQRWAVQVEPDPGYSGRLDQDFEAAHGPYIGTGTYPDSLTFFRGRNNPAPAVTNIGWDWALGANSRHYESYGGYVGNYFTMDQYARTSMGDLRRYIDIGSPWSQTYLYEDFRVVGAVEVREDFEMMNIPAGQWPATAGIAATVWHDAFI